MRFFVSILLLCAVTESLFGQRMPRENPSNTPVAPAFKSAFREMPVWPPALKRPGHYTVSEWRQLIDTTWGPGLPTEQKLRVFDTFWDNVHWTWGGFPNLDINWDSLRAVYRPRVAAGMSRGAFAGVMSRLTRALCEWHAYAMDVGIDSSMFLYQEYPALASFWYRPGIPLMNLTATILWSSFGAGVTAIDDSIALVYSVMPNHPLGLRPGDVILGYDGRPWRECLRQLFDAEMPALFGGSVGATTASQSHGLVMSAGLNWGLFDVIDVMKYPSNEIMHYPTALLSSIHPPYLLTTEQMPVAGVPFPDVANDTLVSWGVVEGTNVGYIYAMDWRGRTPELFGRAVVDLTKERKVDGLILDFRTNLGGSPSNANDGFRHLFGFDPTYNYSLAIRAAGNDHFLFRNDPPWAADHLIPALSVFCGPVAVLTGPNCGSAGDYNAFRLRLHPLVRFFGKETAGAYTTFSFEPADSIYTGTLPGSYYARIDNGTVFSHYAGEGYMIHKAFPVDEEVWLTRDGVARGEDDVVQRAMEWIQGVPRIRNFTVPLYARPGGDSVTVSAQVVGRAGHPLSAVLTLTDTMGTVLDSVAMVTSGIPGDSTLRARFRAPTLKTIYSVNLRTHDQATGISGFFPRAAYFTTLGPVECIGDTLSTVPLWGTDPLIRLKFRNGDSEVPVTGLTAVMRSLDTAARVANMGQMSIGGLAPGQVVLSPVLSLSFSKWGSGEREIPFELVFLCSSVEMWRDTIRIRVTGSTQVADEGERPVSFALMQNYPNPFNATTGIRYGVGVVSREWHALSGVEGLVAARVRLAVYDLLGREVAVLVDEQKAPGRYQVEFDGTRLASGVYICRMTAGNYVESRKMVLAK